MRFKDGECGIDGVFASLTRRAGKPGPYPVNPWAGHASLSCNQGREKRNNFSIGLARKETGVSPYAAGQDQPLTAVAQRRIHRYSHKAHPMTTHGYIAPKRKTDSGRAFDWPRMTGAAEETINKEST